MEASDKPGSARELLHVAWPLVISAGSTSLMYVIDRVLLTWLTTQASAAALPAALVYWALVSFAAGTAGYVNTFVAQYEGAGQKNRVAAVLWHGIYFSLIASALLLFVVPFGPYIFRMFAATEAVRQMELDYFDVLCYGTAPLLISIVLGCFFTGRGQTKTVMWVSIASLGLNAVLDYVLIFGCAGLPAWMPGRQRLPAYGIAGAAAATSISYVFSAGLYALALVRGPWAGEYKLWSGRTFDAKLFWRLLRFGLPNGLQQFVDVGCFTIFIQLISTLGEQELAATNLAFNLNTLAFVPMLGLGTAVMTLVGRRVVQGRDDLAARTTWIAFGMATIYMSLFIGLYLFAPWFMLWPYTLGDNPQEFRALEPQIVRLLRFVAVYSLFDAMSIVFGSATRGAGDTRFALLFSLISGVCLLVAPTYLAFELGWASLTSAWIFATAFVAALGVGFLLRFRQGRWRTMRVIEHAAV